MIRQEVYEGTGTAPGGNLPSYAWPGGYPMAYVFEDGDTCCPDCANGDARDEDGGGWDVVGWFIHYEGEAEICAHCGEEIESAYGDPAEEVAS